MLGYSVGHGAKEAAPRQSDEKGLLGRWSWLGWVQEAEYGVGGGDRTAGFRKKKTCARERAAASQRKPQCWGYMCPVPDSLW